MNENINIHDNYPSSQQKIEVPTMKVIPLKKICMTIGELPTAYLETMTYYEMLLWFIAYLRDNIIPVVNGNGEAVQELQNVVMNLQSYINDFKDSIDSNVEDLENYMNNYFDNLDVQEEINNKLDEYLENGTLEDIIASYLQTQKIYNTYVEMVADASNLVDGLRVQTLGYYNLNDGGGAFYVISSTADVTKYQEQIGSFYAEMIIENDTINFKQIGAKGNDNTFDNKNYLLKYESICNTLDKRIHLYIPEGTWYFTPTHITRQKGIWITGSSGMAGRSSKGTELKPMTSQDYIIKLGGKSDMELTTLGYDETVTTCILEHLSFGSEYRVNYGCLVLEYCCYGTFNYLYFIENRYEFKNPVQHTFSQGFYLFF